MRLHFLGPVFVAMMLSGCSVFGPVSQEQQSTYVINAIPKPIVAKHQRGGTLLVTMPDTAPAYNTTQMAYSNRPFQVGYFSQNQWAETPGQMFFPLIVQTLENRHYYRAVVGSPFGGRTDYTLNTNIIALQQNYTCKPAILQLVVSAQLNRTLTNEVVAIKQFVIRVPLMQPNPYAGVIAANEASVRLLDDLIQFTESV
ncbi:MAG: ABC-type transport auxiliary lipoprotein family protein [Gammaproteobacteria bacterium]